MRKGLMLTSVAGALSMVLGGAALGQTHVPDLGSWTVTKGTISLPTYCTGGSYECSVVATGPGFMQLNVSAAANKTVTTLLPGESFIQTIVTDQDQSGNSGSLPFQDVSFVKMSLSLGGTQNQTQNGIYGQQSIIESKRADTPGGPSEAFTSDTTIATGWGLQAGSSSIVINQGIDNQGGTAGTQSDDFISGFKYESTIGADGKRNGLSMNISQVAGLKGTNGSDTDVQVFALRERSGTFNPAAGSTTALNGTGNKTVPWVAGEDMKAIWVGQNINLATEGSGVVGALGSTFGYLSFENLTKATNATDRLATEFGFAPKNATSAWAWSPLFGTAPTLAAP